MVKTVKRNISGEILNKVTSSAQVRTALEIVRAVKHNAGLIAEKQGYIEARNLQIKEHKEALAGLDEKFDNLNLTDEEFDLVQEKMNSKTQD